MKPIMTIEDEAEYEDPCSHFCSTFHLKMIRVPTNPDELPVCKTCLQRYGCQEKDARRKKKNFGSYQLLWRVFYDGVDDATGEPYRYPGTGECYVCWDDRRNDEPKGTTQDQVITKKKCIKTKAKIETRRAARVISKFRKRKMNIARLCKMKIARLTEGMHEAAVLSGSEVRLKKSVELDYDPENPEASSDDLRYL